MSEKPQETTMDVRERLRRTFVDHDPSTHPSRWDTLWEKNDTPWDQGKPSPALVDFLNSPGDLLPLPQLAPKESNPEQKIRRKRALVPGCGKGYDVLLLASHGYDAYGVEGSQTALTVAEEGMQGYKDKAEYKIHDEKVGRGEAKFLFGDFFKDDWWNAIETGGEKDGFDLIYDYTFLCALPPVLRPRWAQRMSELLSPNGRLVCLEFPTYKLPSTGGPPWAVRPAFYVAYLSKPGESIEYGEDAVLKDFDEENPERSEKGLIRMAHWQPEHTHKIGEGTDWISVWKH